MKGIFLLVETPRAGEHGHRTITSPNAPREVIDRLIDAARAARKGDYFLSAARNVEQRFATGSVREGRETIALIGIDTARLTPTQLRQVQEALEKCLGLVEDLVLNRIDWHVEGRQELVVTRRELANWLNDFFPKDLPLWSGECFSGAIRNTGPEKPPGGRKRSFQWLAVICVLIAVSACAFLYFQRDKIGCAIGFGNQQQTEPLSQHTDSEDVSPEPVIWTIEDHPSVKAFARGCDITPEPGETLEQAVTRILRNTYQAEDTLLNDIKSSPSGSQLTVSPWLLLNRYEEDRLCVFFTKTQIRGDASLRLPVNDALGFRRQLHEQASQLKGIWKSEWPFGNDLENKDFARLLQVMKEFSTLEVDPANLISMPYFDVSDELIVLKIKKLANSLYRIAPDAFYIHQAPNADSWPQIIWSMRESNVVNALHEQRKTISDPTLLGVLEKVIDGINFALQ